MWECFFAFDFMREIGPSSHEQALGVTQVGEAVTHMDESTQQNAALVEEMAAAASTLKFQAAELVQTVSVFKMISGSDYLKSYPDIKNAKRTNHGSDRDLVLLS